MRNLKFLAAAIIALTAPVVANATLSLSLYDGTTTVTVDDGSALDLNSLAGVVLYSGSVGNWVVNTVTAIGGSILPNAIDLSSVNVTSNSGGTLTVKLSETDLNYGVAGLAGITAAIGGTSVGSGTFALYADDANGLFAEAMSLFSGSFGTGAFAYSGSGTFALNNPFSLTETVTFTHTGVGATSFDFAADPIPEPGTLALLGLALFGAGAVTRHSKKPG